MMPLLSPVLGLFFEPSVSICQYLSGLPFVRLPSIFPSMTILKDVSPLCMFSFFCNFSHHLSISYMCLPANFPFFSMSTFRKPRVSLYSQISLSTIHTTAHLIHFSIFIIHLFRFWFSFPLSSSLFFEDASFPSAVLFIFLWYMASVMIILPR